jgi:hypothetical protein
MGTDGLLRGIAVQTRDGVIPQIAGDNVNRKYLAYRLPIEGVENLPDLDILQMQVANLISDTVELIEVGADECDVIWLLVVVNPKKVSAGTVYTRLGINTKNVFKYYTSTSYPTKLYERKAVEIRNTLFGVTFPTMAILTTPNFNMQGEHNDCISLRNVQYLSNKKDGRGIILGNGRCSFVVVEGEGLCPATCGTHLNEQRARSYHDIQVRRSELRGTLINSAYEELPSDYRNPYNIVKGMDNVEIIKHVTTIVSVKGDM